MKNIQAMGTIIKEYTDKVVEMKRLINVLSSKGIDPEIDDEIEPNAMLPVKSKLAKVNDEIKRLNELILTNNITMNYKAETKSPVVIQVSSTNSTYRKIQ